MQNSNTELTFTEAKVKKRTEFSSPCKMQNEILKFKIFGHEKETSEKPKEIYSPRESPDSTGSFGFGRTKKINSRVISKNPLPQKQNFGAGFEKLKTK